MRNWLLIYDITTSCKYSYNLWTVVDKCHIKPGACGFEITFAVYVQ